MDGFEDYMLDEDFRVESARDFIGTMSPEEEDFLVKQSDMSPCRNCGEWVSKRNLQGGLCTLCRKSSCHEEIRGKSQVAGENYQTFEKLVERFEELR